MIEAEVSCFFEYDAHATSVYSGASTSFCFTITQSYFTCLQEIVPMDEARLGVLPPNIIIGEAEAPSAPPCSAAPAIMHLWYIAMKQLFCIHFSLPSRLEQTIHVVSICLQLFVACFLNVCFLLTIIRLYSSTPIAQNFFLFVLADLNHILINNIRKAPRTSTGNFH